MTFLDTYRSSNPFMDYNHIEAVMTEPDNGEVKVVLQPDSLNVHGVAHGGLLFTLADCVAGLTARSDNRAYVTQSAHINFIRNVAEGTIYARGRTISRGRTIVIVRVEITTGDGTLLADGTVDMYCVGQTFRKPAKK